MIIDTHSHLYVEEFDEDRDEAVARAMDNGVGHLMLPCIDMSSLQRMQNLSDDYPGYCSQMIGLHPTELGKNWQDTLRDMYSVLKSNPEKYIGIGEVGLDLYWDKNQEAEQKEVLKEQLCWAREFDKPLVIHCREAWNELVEIFDEYPRDTFRGIFHCFTGTADEANKLLEYPNFKLGIGGVITFKKSVLPETLKEIPLNRIVLETDCPYLAPAPNRGKRNESSFIVYVLQKVCEVYNMSEQDVLNVINNNVYEIFGTF